MELKRVLADALKLIDDKRLAKDARLTITVVASSLTRATAIAQALMDASEVTVQDFEHLNTEFQIVSTHQLKTHPNRVRGRTRVFVYIEQGCLQSLRPDESAGVYHSLHNSLITGAAILGQVASDRMVQVRLPNTDDGNAHMLFGPMTKPD